MTECHRVWGGGSGMLTTRIVIVRRPDDDLENILYVVHPLMEQWRKWGFNVEVISNMKYSPKFGPLIKV
jgi:hypothetical protein